MRLLPSSRTDVFSQTETAPPTARSEWIDFLRFLVKVVTIIIFLRLFVVSSFNIPSESMQPRLLIGDYLFVNKMSYGYSRYSFPFSPDIFGGKRLFGSMPQRGDVVVFKAPPDHQTDYIKRVIGLPGDRVVVRGGQLFLNGKAVQRQRLPDLLLPISPNMDEASSGNPCFRVEFEAMTADGLPACKYRRYREILPGGKSYEVLDLINGPADNTVEYLVPPGHLFMMGDNRDRSYDSRFPAVKDAGIGFVPVENLIGRASIGFFSTDGSADANPISWMTATRWSRIGMGF